jgi:hypothetical protein
MSGLELDAAWLVFGLFVVIVVLLTVGLFADLFGGD